MFINFSILQVKYLDDEVTCTGFKALSTLPHLKRLFFNSLKWEQVHRGVLMCAQFLPRLQMIGMETSEHCLSRLSTGSADSSKLYHKDLVEQQQPVQLSLTHLILKGDTNLHPTCQLPELKALHLLEPCGEILGLIDRFQTITELSFYDANVDLIKLVLGKIGWRLSKLGFQGQLQSMSEYLQLCPNLKCLCLEECRFVDMFFGSRPDDFLQSLEQVNFNVAYTRALTGLIPQVCITWKLNHF